MKGRVGGHLQHLQATLWSWGLPGCPPIEQGGHCTPGLGAGGGGWSLLTCALGLRPGSVPTCTEEADELDRLVTAKTEPVQYDHLNHTVTVTTISNLDFSAARLLGLPPPEVGLPRSPREEGTQGQPGWPGGH